MTEQSRVVRKVVADIADLPAAPAPASQPSDPMPSLRGHKAAAAPARQAKGNSAIVTLTFGASILAVLGYAWSLRAERHITAETGLGYALGIVGALMILALLLYPLRKKAKSLKRIGTISMWFKVHMVMGIVGPALIVLHSNFRLSAANSTVAMFSMLTVVASGIIGRFLYAKIHTGLYGQKAELASLYNDAETFRTAFGADIAHATGLEAELKAGEQAIFTSAQTTRQSLRLLVTLAISRRGRTNALMEEVQTVMKTAALRERWDSETLEARLRAARDHLEQYQSSLLKAVSFRFYERLFGLWRVLHLPLFFLLILTAIVHVVAVHLY